MKKLLLSLVAAFAAFSMSAQSFNIEQPVKWSASYEKIGQDLYEIIITGTIADQSWHIYDMTEYENGPNSTILTIVENDNVKAEGKPYMKSKVIKKYEPMYEQEIGICTGKIIAAQKVKVTGSGDITLYAVIEWQACDEGHCLPPTEEEFKIIIKR